ncbi:ComEC/Rec2 family competence protein [Zhaonella formicivorans]|uniref:ComEC/Rec2 family competence protein n=1 Tax=Zhaonella formicivorans TaxID=2528593 RepID=UPI001D113562|nr:ComEC/Rec2 family competence protein [Zhaonella formicivorans]
MLQKRQLPALLVILFLFLVSLGCSITPDAPYHVEHPANSPVAEGYDGTQKTGHPSELKAGNLKVHFIDVGQADAILVQTPAGKNMLVDAGNNSDSTILLNYLRQAGVKKLDAVIGTHPHEDHIGALDVVLLHIPVQKIYLPDAVHTSQSFEDLLNAIKKKKLKINQAKAGLNLSIDPWLKVEVLAPNRTEYEELNNYSVVLKISYGNTSFLLTGDAESLSESEMLAKGYDLQADVLKVGHHGSNSSSSLDFLRAVKPRYAVITVGKDNEYGHPHRQTLSRLKKVGARILRTDEVGHIVFTSDGAKISVTTQKARLGGR